MYTYEILRYIALILVVLFVGMFFTSLQLDYSSTEHAPDQVIGDLDAEKNNIKKAIDLVHERSDVQQWRALFFGSGNISPKTGGRSVISYQSHEGNIYTVHAYESLDDRIVTFDWFEVDISTGEVTSLVKGLVD